MACFQSPNIALHVHMGPIKTEHLLVRFGLVGWVRQKPFLWNPSVNQGVGGALFLEAKQFWNVFDILPLF